jgi:hypothetical protein
MKEGCRIDEFRKSREIMDTKNQDSAMRETEDLPLCKREVFNAIAVQRQDDRQ